MYFKIAEIQGKDDVATTDIRMIEIIIQITLVTSDLSLSNWVIL